MAWPVLALGGSVAGFFSVLARFLVPYLIVKVLLALGVVAVSITGSLWLVGYVETTVLTQFNSIPSDVGAIAIRAGMLDAFTIIFNSWVIAFNLRALMGSFKRFKLS